jgi:hypothetical protein
LRSLKTEIIKLSDQAKGFVQLPKRWIVERTIAWLNRCRRLAKDWENLNRNALAFLKLASSVSCCEGFVTFDEVLKRVLSRGTQAALVLGRKIQNPPSVDRAGDRQRAETSAQERARKHHVAPDLEADCGEHANRTGE